MPNSGSTLTGCGAVVVGGTRGVGLAVAEDVTGQIFIAADGFVGRFDRPSPAIVAYRDHRDNPPWSVAEIDGLVHRGGEGG